ncbi:pyridoxamine 5'-phosphate oxidase family protein [Streptomyces sp. NPDC059862]|uniref:pyridoxamine 5'-phosphate oxidase family protein n=1 Tax=Streptomyces sp. NPDC059862 TaxID=3346975 RepID=UPI00364E28A9
MTKQTSPNLVSPAEGLRPGDLGRRLARRRAEAGLTLHETAARAGVPPSYLQYLEECPTALPGTGVLRKLAGSLGTSLNELTGGRADLPTGLGQAARAPVFVELSAQECRALLSTHGVGRVAVPDTPGPVVVPVNYSVVDGAIVFRTAPGATPWRAVDTQVAFEVDHVDDALSQGWSVLVRGHARAVTDPDAVSRLERQAYSAPWVGGRRDVWVSIEPLSMTGRRIVSSL